jgi:hypothetical protein
MTLLGTSRRLWLLLAAAGLSGSVLAGAALATEPVPVPEGQTTEAPAAVQVAPEDTVETTKQLDTDALEGESGLDSTMSTQGPRGECPHRRQVVMSPSV